MRTRPPSDPSLSDRLDTLTEEVAALRDLFSRRLAEDKSANRLRHALEAQLERSAGTVAEDLHLGLAGELLLVIDRIGTMSEPGQVEVDSIKAELLEVLSRRGVRAITKVAHFDPAAHEAISTVPATEEHPPGTIVEMIRPGYRLNERLVRPARVVVAAGTDGAADDAE